MPRQLNPQQLRSVDSSEKILIAAQNRTQKDPGIDGKLSFTSEPRKGIKGTEQTQYVRGGYSCGQHKHADTFAKNRRILL
jgi:hypothetical protein